jgi:hypothetical protein
VGGTGAPLPFLYDVVQLHPDLHERDEPRDETEPGLQPRPNVLIELGMALGTHRGRTVVVEVGRLRPIADLAGLNAIRFDGSEAGLHKIVCRLRLTGCKIDDAGVDWRRPRRFAGLGAFERRAEEHEPRH